MSCVCSPPEIAERPQIVVLTKKDTSPEADSFSAYKEEFEARGLRCLQISAVTGEGLDELLTELSTELEKAKREEAQVVLKSQERENDESSL